ncbi:MAG: hypothetical protein HOB64_14620, partial [Rhodospirillaceae bacterium]|nr:hypothetical protein [Rhodospirillaceae bacterium]
MSNPRTGLISQYAAAFADNAIDLDSLPHISDDDLKELGLPLGHRRKLQAAIEALETKDESFERPSSPDPVPATQSSDAERRQLT